MFDACEEIRRNHKEHNLFYFNNKREKKFTNEFFFNSFKKDFTKDYIKLASDKFKQITGGIKNK